MLTLKTFQKRKEIKKNIDIRVVNTLEINL